MSGWVYFASDKKRKGEIKIGFSRNPLARMNGLGGKRMSLVALEGGEHERERQLHARFSEFRLDGEWFTYAPEIQEHVQSLPAIDRDALPDPITHRQIQIDRHFYDLIVAEAKKGTRNISGQLRIIFKSYFKENKTWKPS